MTASLYLAVETGGTKTIARLARSDGEILAGARWPTTTPDAACEQIVAFVRANASEKELASAGLAAFGPISVDPAALDFGRMLATPKPGWTGSNLRKALSERLGVAVAVDTDVNAAALAEQAIGAGKGCRNLAYLTVGTGIGAGLAIDGVSLRGALHPELGHLRLVRAPSDDLPSACPYHSDCAEGLAAGPAVRARLQGATLGEREDVRRLVADYLAQIAAAIILAWSPHRIVIGGGVGSAPGVIEGIRRAYIHALGGYGVGPDAMAPGFLMPAALADAGLEGALLMARRAATETEE